MVRSAHIKRPKIEDSAPVWLTLDEANRLIEACADHLRPPVIFLIYTGARVGEALWLDWSNVDLTHGRVSFPKTKNGDARGVPLHPRVIAALGNLQPPRDGEVFRRQDGLPYERPAEDDDADTSAGTRIKTAFKGAVRRAGITKLVSPHNCRHTWATWHYAGNRDIGALQRLGGWKSVEMVMRYTHVNVDELKGTINALPGGAAGTWGKSGDDDITKAESA